MKALQFSAYKPAAGLTVKEIPRPEPCKGEVLVQIRAAGDLQAPPITTWPFERANKACEAVKKVGASTSHTLVPGAKQEL
jgi:hypothetical protein